MIDEPPLNRCIIWSLIIKAALNARIVAIDVELPLNARIVAIDVEIHDYRCSTCKSKNYYLVNTMFDKQSRQVIKG